MLLTAVTSITNLTECSHLQGARATYSGTKQCNARQSRGIHENIHLLSNSSAFDTQMSRSPKSAAPGPTDRSDIPIQLSILSLLIIIVRLQLSLQTAALARSHHCFGSHKTQVPRPPLPGFVPTSNLTELPMPCNPEKTQNMFQAQTIRICMPPATASCSPARKQSYRP